MTGISFRELDERFPEELGGGGGAVVVRIGVTSKGPGGLVVKR